MDRFTNLQTYLSIINTGSISGAAEQLRVAKSAISRRVTELYDAVPVQASCTHRFHQTIP